MATLMVEQSDLTTAGHLDALTVETMDFCSVEHLVSLTVCVTVVTMDFRWVESREHQ